MQDADDAPRVADKADRWKGWILALEIPLHVSKVSVSSF
jgi:hypothetical protein